MELMADQEGEERIPDDGELEAMEGSGDNF